MKTYLFGLLTLVFFFSGYSDTIYANTRLAYNIYLPSKWIVESRNDSVDCFYDTSLAYKSRLFLVRHNRDAALYPTPASWVNAYFIATKMFLEYYPYSACLYNDSLRAELYSMYFADDTTELVWSEYTRFAACGLCGYEMYALGDTTDMKTNVSLYAAILRMVDLLDNTSIKQPLFAPPFTGKALERAEYGFDVLGRKIQIMKSMDRKNLSSTVYFSKIRSGTSLR